MIGGILTSFLLELVVYPAVYQIWKWNFELKRRSALMPGQAPSANPGLMPEHATNNDLVSLERL